MTAHECELCHHTYAAAQPQTCLACNAVICRRCAFLRYCVDCYATLTAQADYNAAYNASDAYHHLEDSR